MLTFEEAKADGAHPCIPRIRVGHGMYISCDDSPPCQNVNEDVDIDYEECQKRCGYRCRQSLVR